MIYIFATPDVERIKNRNYFPVLIVQYCIHAATSTCTSLSYDTKIPMYHLYMTFPALRTNDTHVLINIISVFFQYYVTHVSNSTLFF